MESGFPFISFSYLHKVLSVSKVDLGVHLGLPRNVEEVQEKWKGVSVLPSDLVETTVINTKPKGAILLANKKDRSTMRKLRGTNEIDVDVLVDKISEGTELGL